MDTVGIRQRVRLANAERQRRWRERRAAAAERELVPLKFASDEEDEVREEEVGEICGRIEHFFTYELLQCPGRRSREAVIERFMGSEVIQPHLPSYYLPPADAKAQCLIVENLQGQLHLAKGVQSTEKLQYRSAILDAAVSGDVRRQGKAISRLLKTRPSNIKKACERRVTLVSSGISQFALPKRRRRSDVLSEAVVDLAVDWWTSQTRVSPNRKDTTRNRLGVNKYTVHPTHLLQETLTTFFRRFKFQNPTYKIGQTTFIRLRPFFVKTLKDRTVCCCKYHMEIIMLKDGLNNMRMSRLVHHPQHGCSCDVCNMAEDGEDGSTDCTARHLTYKSITSFWQECVCPKEDDKDWDNKACLLGECESCGVEKMLSLCPDEEFGDSLVKWKCFEKTIVDVNARTGEPKKRIREVFKETSSAEFIRYLKPNLQKFIKHNFIAAWQDAQCRIAMESLPEGTILSHVDFAENYGFQVQNEIQSAYYHSYQVTIMVHITYRVNSDAAIEDEEPKIKKEAHFWISNDKEHDTLYVQYCLMKHWAWLLERGVRPTNHVVFSDGCASQFKACRPMYFVARYRGLTGGCQMCWEYFGTGHGKGEWDGAGAVVKTRLRNEQLQNPDRPLQNATDVVAFLNETMSSRVIMSSKRAGREDIERYFHDIPKDEIPRDELYECDTIAGSRSLHSISSISGADPTKLMVRHLSCYCCSCQVQDWKNCENGNHMSPWALAKLKPKNTRLLRHVIMRSHEEHDMSQFGGSPDTLTDGLAIGDTFAVIAEPGNQERVMYYVLQCQRPKFVVTEAFHCIWGNCFEVGDHAIEGKYFQRWGRGMTNSYVYLNASHPAYIHSHLVKAHGFPMIPSDYRVQGGDPTYKILIPHHLQIMAALV